MLDPSGALVPHARVSVIDGAGRARDVTSNPAGAFQVAVDGPSPFTVVASAPGFADGVITIDSVDAPIAIPLAASRLEERVTVTVQPASVVSTATRTATPLLQLPQAIDVVGQDLLSAQAATSMQDALRNVAAVSVNLGEGRRDQFLIRGFSAQNDTLVDGLRDDAPYFRDLATIERIDVVKGPAAALFGRGSSGGVINRILKAPVRGGSVSEFTVAGGSNGTRRVTADVGRSLRSDRLAFRLVAAGEHSTSFRDGFFLRRGTVAPSLLWATATTSIVAQGEFLDDRRLPDRGIPSVDGAPADVDPGQNYGYPDDDDINTRVTAATVRLEHRLGTTAVLRSVIRAARYDTSFSNTAPNGTRLVGGSWRVLRQQYNVDQAQRNLFNQTELIFPLSFSRTTHLVLTGVEIGAQTRDQVRFNGTAADVALIDPVLTRPQYATVAATDNRFDGRVAAVYAQDQIGFGSRWKALVGLRGDRFAQSLDDRTRANVDLARVDVTWSPRAGVLYQPTRSTSVYGSVSRSFQPSGEGLSLAANAAELKPETSRNVEAGAKASLFGGAASATVAVFRLDRRDIKTTDPIDSTRLVLVGRQRTDGLELTLDGRVLPRLAVHGSYAWLDAVVLRSNTVTSGVRIEGNRPGLVPTHSASIWTDVWLQPRWQVGAGVTATGDRFTSNDDLVTLPDFRQLDLASAYSVGPWQFALNARNVLDRRFAATAAGNYQIYPGAPREFVLTIRVKP